MQRVSPFLKKAASVGVTAALLVCTPGLGAWEAFAQVAPIRVNAPLGGIGAMGAAGAAARGSVAQPTMPGLSLPVMGLPGLAPTIADPRLSAPGSVALPASALPGVAADPFAKFAQPGPVVPEGRWTPPPGPGGAQAAALPAAGAAQALSGGDSGLSVSRPETAADGLPADMAKTFGTVRGRANALGQRFGELRAAFGLKGDADLQPVNAVRGELRPGAPTQAPAVGGFLSRFKPLSAARTGLARLIGVGRASSAPQAPPQPLVLKTSSDGMALSIEAAPANKVTTEEAPTPAPAPAPAPTPEKPSGWFGLGKTAVFFIGSLVVAQIGVEALGAAMPTLVQQTFGDFTAVAQLAVFSSIASVVGRQLGPVAVRRFGLKTSYLGASALRLVSISVLAGLLATGHMTLPLMMAFYSINGLLSGISLTAMESIPPAIVGQNQGRIERFWTVEQTILEIIGIAGPIATGAIVASFGFLPALIAFPVTMAASLAIVLMTLRLPKGIDEADAASKAKAAAAPKKGFFEKIFKGAKLVWTNPVLRTAFIAYTAYTMLNPFLYTMLGPAYGIALLGAEQAQAATGVIGWLTGMYSLGGLLGGFLMMWEQKGMKAEDAARRAAHEASAGKVSDEAWAELSKAWESEVLRKSLLKWMLLGTAGLAGVAAMAVPLGMLSSYVALPAFLSWMGNLTLPALTLIPFGIAQVVAMLKLRSFFQASVPDAKENMADAMGFFGSASLAVTTVGLLSLKYLFQAFTGFTPFFYIAAAMVPLAAAYLYLRWRLNRLTAPSK